MIKISFKTATELCQIDRSEAGTTTKASLVVIKKQKVLTQDKNGNDVVLYTPYYTGNSFRGKLRRICTQMLLEKAVEKGINLKKAVDSFHLMNAGGGNLHGTQPYGIEEKVRELNPVISVFGASLAIEGKILTSNMMPYESYIDGVPSYYMRESDGGGVYCPIEAEEGFIKSDDLLDDSGNAKYMPREAVEEWAAKALDNAKNVSASRSLKEAGVDVKKVKKETIKGQMRRSFVIRGVDFYGSISELSPLTEIEKGMIVRGMEKQVIGHLGSNSAKGFGLVNYNLTFDDGSVLKTEVNEFLKPRIIQRDYSESTLSCVKAFDEWLENIEEENILIENSLVKSK